MQIGVSDQASKTLHNDIRIYINGANMTAKHYLVLILVAAMAITVAGCFPRDASMPTDSRAGFFMGIWHGWIAPISLIVGFFDHDVRIYQPHNTGWFYDLGFYIAVIAGFGGITFSRKRKKQNSKAS
jgi:hypothetical protein